MLIARRAAALVVLVIVSLGGLSACSDGAGTIAVDPADAATKVSAAAAVDLLAQPGIVIIDVRTPAEFSGGHLAGAVNLDAQGSSFEQQLADLPLADPYFVYCQSGNRSAVATARMGELGFTTVYDLQGGVADWQAAGGELATS